MRKTPDRQLETAICANCGKTFEKHREYQKYCSDTCRVEAWHFRTAGKKVISDILARLDRLEKKLQEIEKKET